ncbi:hypothetical protein GMLC_06460 [Geomonas limicola]|uniref:Nucleotidyltransferase n=1 Tax=Geomonas limicola TaxID=2740186 RepID=A0A6V8N5G9_9BACT|nr:putative nucleotidyltransferase substrate binding domain-containing protein [Geomonas limicola]GFO67067.1 hypothetical protein GMLC_06460 [Geomonas limicola]
MPAFPEEINSDAELVTGARKSLFERTRQLTPEQTLEAIEDLKAWVAEELAFEEGASASFGRVLSELWHAEYLDQLPPLLNRFERLVAAYYVRRGSVIAFQGFCNAWRDGVLRRVLQFAEEGPELNDLGHAPAPFALLASGSLGRREQTLEESDRCVLVWKDEDDTGYFEPFAYRIIAILDQYGLIGKEGAFLGKALWRGSLEKWAHYLSCEVQPPDQPNRLETIADLRVVCGDESIGADAVRLARVFLTRSRDSEEMLELARGVVEQPVALGIMGGLRVEKTGEHAGHLNPEKGGLQPLVEAVRLLAARHGLESGPTLDRIAALATLGGLTVAQAERFSAAYHVLAGFKVRREIALEHPYLSPAALAETDRERLKEAFESVRQLQRLLRCRFLGKESSGPRRGK